MQALHSSQHLHQRVVGCCLAIAGLLLVDDAVLVGDEPIDQAVVSRVPAKVHRYVDRLLQRRDLDGDGKLSKDEWQAMSGDPAQIDLNGDAIVTSEELLMHVGRYGLARMPVRLLPPREEPSPEPAVTLQSPNSEAITESENTDELALPSSEADGGETSTGGTTEDTE